MIKVGLTLYLFNKCYIHCKDDVIEIVSDDKKCRFPYENVSEILLFYKDITLSSYLVQKCSENNIIIHCLSPYGFYQGAFWGQLSGNVVLRKKQFDMIHTEKEISYAKNEIAGKLYNSAWMLSYLGHHNSEREIIKDASCYLRECKSKLKNLNSLDDIRILEANAACKYFSMFDYLIKTDDAQMQFDKRTRKPPLNNVNALLSFFYTLLTSICCSALLCKGLDVECGYLHTLRSGRYSLACDLVEEFRSCIVDRFVITLINRKEVTSLDFEHNVDGIKLKDESRKRLLEKWEIFLQNTKVKHKLYDKEYSIKVVIYEQAKLLAQYIRGDIEEYPPFVMS